MAGEADIIGGIAGGAATGAAFGPVGAVIGGAIGGIGGLLSAGAKKKARKYTRKANALREQAYKLRSFAEQRTLLRQGQIQAASVIASAPGTGADVSSSGFQGINASVWKQMLDNYSVGAELLNTQLQANVFEEKAGKQVARAETIGDIMNAGSMLINAIPRGTGGSGSGWTYDGALPSASNGNGVTTYPVGGPGERAGASLTLSNRGN